MHSQNVPLGPEEIEVCYNDRINAIKIRLRGIEPVIGYQFHQ